MVQLTRHVHGSIFEPEQVALRFGVSASTCLCASMDAFLKSNSVFWLSIESLLLSISIFGLSMPLYVIQYCVPMVVAVPTTTPSMDAIKVAFQVGSGCGDVVNYLILFLC